MFRYVIRGASQLDAWLRRRLGRPYAVALSVGLLLDILHRVREAPHHIQSMHGRIGVALAVLMEMALLVHQVGELHARFEQEPEGGPSSDPGAAK